MRKILFTVISTSTHYQCEYYDDHTYSDQHVWPTSWRISDGEVQFKSLLGVWFRDIEEAQAAYLNYLAKLITEET